MKVKMKTKTENYVLGVGGSLLSGGTLGESALGALSIQKLKTSGHLGKVITNKQIDKKSTKTTIFFVSVESVDNLIDKLNVVKKSMEKRQSDLQEFLQDQLKGVGVSLVDIETRRSQPAGKKALKEDLTLALSKTGKAWKKVDAKKSVAKAKKAK